MPEASDRPTVASDEQTADELFTGLYKRHASGIRRLALARTGDRELAEDVVQETFLKAHRSLGSFDRSRPPWPWLSSIAKNAVIDALRRKQRSSEMPYADLGDELDPEDPKADPEIALMAIERRGAITEVMRSLNSRHRRLLILKDAQGWGREDIAESEGISLESVKCALWRARRAFRKRYEEIAVERGLQGLVWPVLPFVMRLRNLRARVEGQTVGLGPMAVGLPQIAVGAIAATIAATALMTTGTSPAERTRDTASSVPTVETVGTVSRDEGTGALETPPPKGVAPAPAAPRGTSTAVSTRDVAPESPAEAGAAGTLENGERATVSARVWTRIGQNEPEAGSGLELYCNSEVRQRLCDAIDAGP